jgi:TolA-binding protein
MDTAFRYFTRASGGYHPAPLELPTLMQLANALLVSGRYGPAARVYEAVLQDFPDSPVTPEADFRLGTILSRVFDDYLRAREHLVRAYEDHPDERRRAQAYNELKWIDAQLRTRLLRRSGDKRE